MCSAVCCPSEVDLGCRRKVSECTRGDKPERRVPLLVSASTSSLDFLCGFSSMVDYNM